MNKTVMLSSKKKKICFKLKEKNKALMFPYLLYLKLSEQNKAEGPIDMQLWIW